MSSSKKNLLSVIKNKESFALLSKEKVLVQKKKNIKQKTWSDWESNQSNSSYSNETRNHPNNHLIVFVVPINSNFDYIHNLEFDGDSECNFDSIHDAYEVSFEESPKIKVESVKVNNLI